MDDMVNSEKFDSPRKRFEARKGVDVGVFLFIGFKDGTFVVNSGMWLVVLSFTELVSFPLKFDSPRERFEARKGLAIDAFLFAGFFVGIVVFDLEVGS